MGLHLLSLSLSGSLISSIRHVVFELQHNTALSCKTVFRVNIFTSCAWVIVNIYTLRFCAHVYWVLNFAYNSFMADIRKKIALCASLAYNSFMADIRKKSALCASQRRRLGSASLRSGMLFSNFNKHASIVV